MTDLMRQHFQTRLLRKVEEEVLAISDAAFELLLRENVENAIRLLSDSQAANNAIRVFQTTSKVVADYKKTLKLPTSQQVEIV